LKLGINNHGLRRQNNIVVFIIEPPYYLKLGINNHGLRFQNNIIIVFIIEPH